jgi:hypothetical protein
MLNSTFITPLDESAIDTMALYIHHAAATTQLVHLIESNCSVVLGNFTVPIHNTSYIGPPGIRAYVSFWAL